MRGTGCEIDSGENKGTSDLTGLEKRPRGSETSTEAELEAIRHCARTAARAAVDVKGEDVKVLDVHEVVAYTDFMVVCTGRNTRLTRRIAEEVTHKVKKEAGIQARGKEGDGSGEWILIDFVDFVVHVFTPEAREFYRLDVLWKQAPAEEIS